MRKAAFRIIKDYEFEAIIASSPPLMTLNIANALHKVYNIPWIADFRDLFDEFKDVKKSQIARLQLIQEKGVCKTAEALSTVSAPLAEKLSSRYSSPCHIIFNGFDPDDFTVPLCSDSNYFSIVYCGSIFGDRDPSLLFDAIDLLLNKNKVSLSKLRIFFYGVNSDKIDFHIKNRVCYSIVRAMDRVPFNQIIPIEQSATILLLLSHPNNKGIMTSKVFEYLGAKRPILSIPGDGDVTDQLLKETQAGFSVDNVEELSNILLRMYNEWKETGYVTYTGNSEKIRKYTRHNQALKMAEILDGLASHR